MMTNPKRSFIHSRSFLSALGIGTMFKSRTATFSSSDIAGASTEPDHQNVGYLNGGMQKEEMHIPWLLKSRLQCAGINRHEVEDERALRVKSSDLLGPESCAATVRDPAKRRQGLAGVGIQLRKDAIRTPPPL
jgi:hypothetical protein